MRRCGRAPNYDDRVHPETEQRPAAEQHIQGVIERGFASSPEIDAERSPCSKVWKRLVRFATCPSQKGLDFCCKQSVSVVTLMPCPSRILPHW
jgi:hypothetical protein